MQKLCRGEPSALAVLRGSAGYPEISGTVSFYDTKDGCVVMAEVVGLPDSDLSQACAQNAGSRFFGFHIHEGSRCSGNGQDAFADAGGHFNPGKAEHPFHAGDLPPLMSNCGYAWAAVYTERFFSADVLGRLLIIHEMPDDFRTQPSGDSGKKIACGRIIR
jgi:Cu-Zn family superoxide dismutase